MADNYLENRMEELRSGRLRMEIKKTVAKPRKGMWQLPFPSRRVLLALENLPLSELLVDEFTKLECKVAMFDMDRERGMRLAHDKGIRFYNISGSDAESGPDDLADNDGESNSYKSAIEKSLEDLLHSWRDVDIIISSPRSAKILLSLWVDHKTRFPFPADYPARLIIVSSTDNPQKNTDCNQIADDFSEAYSNPELEALTRAAAGQGIIIRGIAVDPDKDPMLASRLCMFMCVPGNESVRCRANFCQPFKV